MLTKQLLRLSHLPASCSAIFERAVNENQDTPHPIPNSTEIFSINHTTSGALPASSLPVEMVGEPPALSLVHDGKLSEVLYSCSQNKRLLLTPGRGIDVRVQETQLSFLRLQIH